MISEIQQIHTQTNELGDPTNPAVSQINQILKNIKKTLIGIFDDSVNFRVFPEKQKLTKVTPIFKSGKNKLLTNYRPKSVLPCFLKILERIMCKNVSISN